MSYIISYISFHIPFNELSIHVAYDSIYVIYNISCIIYNLSNPHVLLLDGWATDDLIYKWKDVDPVQIVPGLHLPRFTLEQYKSAYCNVITNTGM